jgi:hypothetical protein
MQSHGRPKKKRFRKDKIRGPKEAATAAIIAEPAKEGNDKVW